MRGIKRSVAALAALAAALAVTPIAAAQEAVTPAFRLVGKVFSPGDGFTVTITEGTCPGGPVSLTSPGFASVDLAALRGRVVTTPGSYTATLKCKDTTEVGTSQFEIQRATDPSKGTFLDKEEYAPGQTVTVYGQHPSCGGGHATAVSQGFVAPAVLDKVASHGGSYGEAKAIDTPGTYVVTLWCAFPGLQHDQFTIKVPSTTTPPAPAPPGRKPPIVKPKGPADTGGGGTA